MTKAGRVNFDEKVMVAARRYRSLAKLVWLVKLRNISNAVFIEFAFCERKISWASQSCLLEVVPASGRLNEVLRAMQVLLNPSILRPGRSEAPSSIDQ